MLSLRSLLQRVGYSENEIIGIAQLGLLPFRDGTINMFGHFNNLYICTDPDALDIREKTWIKDIASLEVTPDKIPLEWQDSSLWEHDSTVNQLLDYEFNLSEAELFKVLVGLTQLQFFLNARFKVFKGSTNQYELDNIQDMRAPVQKLIKRLGFCDSREYILADGVIKSVFVHAASEVALTPRLQILDVIVKSQVNRVVAYYATNPRGLSIHESSTAEILANWFTKNIDLQKNIAEHLKELFNGFKSLKLDWFNALDVIRDKILISINEEFKLDLTSFPRAPGGETYHPAYDKAAELEKRDSLKNSWPHVGHLLCHLSQKLNIDLTKVHFEIIPVCGMMVDSRFKPAQTLELVHEFLATIKLDEKRIICISDNSISYGSRRQDLIMKLILQNVGREHSEVITYYDGLDPQKADLERIGKEVAARFNEQLPHIEELMKLDSIKQNLVNQPLPSYTDLLKKNGHFSAANYFAKDSNLELVRIDSDKHNFQPS